MSEMLRNQKYIKKKMDFLHEKIFSRVMETREIVR